MENNKEYSKKQQNSIHEFTQDLANWLTKFDEVLKNSSLPQKKLHDAIIRFGKKTTSEDDNEIILKYLNVALQLTFVLDQGKDNLYKFIDYHTEN